MRGLSLTIAALAAAGAVQAQTPSGDLASRRLEVQGDVTAACVLEQAQMTDLVNITSATTPEGGATLTLTPQQFVDSSGFLAASSARISFRVVCSGAHTLSVSSARGGLQLADPVSDPGGFRTAIDLGVELAWAQAVASFDTGEGDQTARVEIADAAAGLADMTITIPAMNERLVAGVYSDELVIQLTPDD